jgi:hypothetical protein
MAALQQSMKKRQIIANSNRTMFIWVAIVSAVVGICIVVGYFLVQQIIYKTKVTNKLDATASTLHTNNSNAQTLIENVRVLETNAGLNSVKAQPDEKALQVVLDALPADANTLALGASLQQNLLVGISGLTVDSLSVTPIDSDSTAVDGQLPFTLTVRAKDANALKDLLGKFERSIRIIDVDNFTLERSETDYSMTIQAHAYYQAAKQVVLKNEVVPVR